MNAFARVVLHMRASNADALGFFAERNLDVAVFRQRLIIWRDLVALGQVRVEIVLARETRHRPNATIERQTAFHGDFHGLAAQHRQGAGQTQANRTHVSIGRRAEAGGAATEDLGGRRQLNVNLEPDHRLVLGDDIRRSEFLDR